MKGSQEGMTRTKQCVTESSRAHLPPAGKEEQAEFQKQHMDELDVRDFMIFLEAIFGNDKQVPLPGEDVFAKSETK